MAYYHVEVGYVVGKRKSGVALGMTVKAFDAEEAEEIARKHALAGKKNRKWHFSNTREATESDIKLGVINA
jgi:hypothetical protein